MGRVNQMRRDMDLCRDILFIIEKSTTAPIFNLKISGRSKDQIAYHCNLLYQAGLVAAYKPLYGDGIICDFGVGDLTWKGQNFLDEVRDDSKWAKAKKEYLNLPPNTLAIDPTKALAVSADIAQIVFGLYDIFK